MNFRRIIIKTFAILLNQDVIFNDDKEDYLIKRDTELKMRKDSYRVAREVWQDGTIHWYIEQYFNSRKTLITLFPQAITENNTRVNGRLVDDISHWQRHPTDYGTMEEAIEDLNNNIRRCEVSEITYLLTTDS